MIPLTGLGGPQAGSMLLGADYRIAMVTAITLNDGVECFHIMGEADVSFENSRRLTDSSACCGVSAACRKRSRMTLAMAALDRVTAKSSTEPSARVRAHPR